MVERCGVACSTLDVFGGVRGDGAWDVGRGSTQALRTMDLVLTIVKINSLSQV